MKPPKPLWRVSVLTSTEAEEAIGSLLAEIFRVAVATYFDLEKQTSLVSVFVEQGKFSAAQSRRQIVNGLKHIQNCGLKLGAGQIEFARVKREDWAESWKRHFPPLEIGSESCHPHHRMKTAIVLAVSVALAADCRIETRTFRLWDRYSSRIRVACHAEPLPVLVCKFATKGGTTP